MACIEARGLRKTLGTTVALAGIDCTSKRRIPRLGGELGLNPTPLVFGDPESTTRTAEPA
jgi:hypothetical protein